MRIAITDDEIIGRWFDPEKAKRFEENCEWDGNNMVPLCTGSWTEHQRLYATASGRWILHTWSLWQGTSDSFRLISDQDAAKWFIINEYQDDDIPSQLTELVLSSEI